MESAARCKVQPQHIYITDTNYCSDSKQQQETGTSYRSQSAGELLAGIWRGYTHRLVQLKNSQIVSTSAFFNADVDTIKYGISELLELRGFLPSIKHAPI